MNIGPAKLIAVAGVIVLALALGWALKAVRDTPGAVQSDSYSVAQQEDTITQAQRIEARERQATGTVWGPEELARRYAAPVEELWNQVNRAADKWSVVAAVRIQELKLPGTGAGATHRHGICVFPANGNGLALPGAEWGRRVVGFAERGWDLVQTEFRHIRFDPARGDTLAGSVFDFSAHFTNRLDGSRSVLEGPLQVAWPPLEQPGVSGEELGVRVDATRLTWKQRGPAPDFELVHREDIAAPENAYAIDPLLVYDLDGDGVMELVLANKNRVYRRTAEGGYMVETLCSDAPGLITTAVLGDFTGDGLVDLLCENFIGLKLFAGAAGGRFESPGRQVWRGPGTLKYAMVLTSGDVDADGDLDVFLAQYRVPYELGAMPTPFHDARDGHPAFLLLNDGRGGFADAAPGRGLEAKRQRRTYSASFVHLDGDDRVDLVVVSDFAGVDLYRNEGGGRFSDVTADWVDEREGFGMAHALADFNADGRMDLLMIGMTSPTAERLEHLGIERAEWVGDRLARRRMVHGNRLWFGRPGGGFVVPDGAASIRRSGWSWGCGAGDFDNDGFVDVYIANGLESRESVRDYEAEYWLHDRWVGTSEENPAAYQYFKAKFARTRGRGFSYGGYEKNRLYLNEGGGAFLEVAPLFGLALEQDSRNVVAADLDGDGGVDLAVTSFEAWPEARQTLRIYRNRLAERGHWIGFHLAPGLAGTVACGTRVRVEWAGRTALREVVTGDSYRSQHPASVHFGLGEQDQVDSFEVIWPDGRRRRVERPKADMYHWMSP